MLREIKKGLNKHRDALCSWIRRFNIVKASILSNVIYRFSIIPIKIPAIYFVDTNKEVN